MPSVRKFVPSYPNGLLFIKQTKPRRQEMPWALLNLLYSRQHLSKESGGVWQGSRSKNFKKTKYVELVWEDQPGFEEGLRQPGVGVPPSMLWDPGLSLGDWIWPPTYLSQLWWLYM